MSKFVAKHDQEEKESPSFSLSSLPEEVALSCLVRVSRSDLAALSLVSKKYQSIVASPEFYEMRSQLGYTTYTRFYVCLKTGLKSTPRWYMFSREKQVNSRRIMTPIPSFSSQIVHGSAVVALDWEIYVIGGSFNYNGEPASSDVFRLDCRTHTWRQVPSMRVARYEAGAGVVDGKIYVFGGCKESEFDSLGYGEVFDPKTQTWENLAPLPWMKQKPLFWLRSSTGFYYMLGSSKGFNCIRESFVMEGKIFAFNYGDKIFYYSPSEGKWGRTNLINVLKPRIYYSPRERRWEIKGMDVEKPRINSYCCVKGKLLYGCDSYGYLFWCESDKFEWKEVKGLEALQKIFPEPLNPPDLNLDGYSPYNYMQKYHSQLRSYGANVMIFWAKYNFIDKIVDVWCAEISFERREEKDEIWGTIEWSEVVATLDLERWHKVEVLYTASVNNL